MPAVRGDPDRFGVDSASVRLSRVRFITSRCATRDVFGVSDQVVSSPRSRSAAVSAESICAARGRPVALAAVSQPESPTANRCSGNTTTMRELYSPKIGGAGRGGGGASATRAESRDTVGSGAGVGAGVGDPPHALRTSATVGNTATRDRRWNGCLDMRGR